MEAQSAYIAGSRGRASGRVPGMVSWEKKTLFDISILRNAEREGE